LKFRVIQSNNRGLISKVGDKTFFSKKPKIGEEFKEMATLFIWVKKPNRFVSRAWTVWTGEKIHKDFIYEVTKFKDILDISGHNEFHQWSRQELREKLWQDNCFKKIFIEENICPNPINVWTNKRNSKSSYLKKRKQQIKEKSMFLSDSEKEKVKDIYETNKKLNQLAGFNKFHVDHIIPLSKGGNHNSKNLRIISAEENLRKGAN